MTDVVVGCAATNQETRVYVLWIVTGVTQINAVVILNIDHRYSKISGLRI